MNPFSHVDRTVIAHKQWNVVLCNSNHIISMKIDHKKEKLTVLNQINIILLYYWTLSSKSFSTLPHSTCSLSDSCLYLALDWVYHPLWIPKQPDSKDTTKDGCQHHKGLAPIRGKAPVRRTQMPATIPSAALSTTASPSQYSQQDMVLGYSHFTCHYYGNPS